MKGRQVIRKLYVVALIAAIGTLAGAQETNDEDDLFGGSLFDEPVIEQDEGQPGATGGTDPATSAVDDLLTSSGTDVGGRAQVSFEAEIDPEEFSELDDVATGYTISPQILLDARPDPDFRFFLKSTVDYTTEAGQPNAVFTVDEVFSDVTVTDWLFLRAGKQNMSWGVGYFFSPADLVSLEAIDPAEPEAELEGPVAVRLHLPALTWNVYGYAMLDEVPNDGSVGAALKAEAFLLNSEFELGGYFRNDAVSGAMVTWSGSISGVELVAEAVLQYGSTIALVEEDGASLVVSNRDSDWFPSATAGFRYRWSDDEENYDLTFTGQYLYNGEGYEDPDILQDSEVDLLIAGGSLAVTDLSGTGRHYLAGNARWQEAFGSDLSPLVLGLANISDGSGLVSVDLTYAANDYLSVTPSYSYIWGEDRDEYALGGTGHRVGISFELGSGRF